MRSQHLILSMIFIAVSGCGKDVSRGAGERAAQTNPAGSPAELRAGECYDRIGRPAYKVVDNFSDVAQSKGVYELTSFEAVGMEPSGISVITGALNGGALEFTQVCSNISGITGEGFEWTVSAPTAMSAVDGSITKDIGFTQRIHSATVAENFPSNAVETACVSASGMISGQGCTGANQLYQIDATTLGVLRTVETRKATGAIVTSKILARYVLKGAVPVEPSTPRTEPGTEVGTNPGNNNRGQGTGNQGTGNQGANVGNKANGKANNKANAKKVEKKKTEKKAEPKKSNTANNANNANNTGNPKGTGGQGTGGQGTGGQGTSTTTVITITPSVDVPVTPAPVTATTMTSPKVKEKEKYKSNSETGMEKSKKSHKEKTTTITTSEDGTQTKTKTKEKSRSKVKTKSSAA